MRVICSRGAPGGDADESGGCPTSDGAFGDTLSAGGHRSKMITMSLININQRYAHVTN
jgi:hypothetical protein